MRSLPDGHSWVWNKSERWIWEQVNMFSFLSHKSHRFKWAFTITFLPASINFPILIFCSRTTGPNWTELGCDTPWMVLFQKCVHWSCPTSKMAAMASDWLKNLKSLKSFFYRTTGFHESKFGSLVQILLGQFPIKILSVDPINYSWPPWLIMQFFFQPDLKFLTSNFIKIVILSYLTFIIPELCPLIMCKMTFFSWN